ERGERARDLAELAIEPTLHRHLGRTIAALVDDQNPGIENPGRERWKPQRVKARLAVLRDNSAAAREHIEIFEQHRRIEQGRAVIEDEHRHLAQWILLHERIVVILRRRRLDFDLAVEAEHAHRDARLAAKRGSKTRT